MNQQKTYFQAGKAGMLADDIPVDNFDQLVDDGYELIVITTETGRYTTTVEDWQDFGYVDLSDTDVEIRVLHRSYMSKS